MRIRSAFILAVALLWARTTADEDDKIIVESSGTYFYEDEHEEYSVDIERGVKRTIELKHSMFVMIKEKGNTQTCADTT